MVKALVWNRWRVPVGAKDPARGSFTLIAAFGRCKINLSDASAATLKFGYERKD
jgi:hypothetical protein